MMTDLLHYVIYPTPNKPDTLGLVREKGGHLDWHMDIGRGAVNRRKLATTVQLSHPDEYEGGNVQLLNDGGKKYIAPRQRGTIVLFDSRTPHRVLKVTKGTRRSIVGWVVGPRWT